MAFQLTGGAIGVLIEVREVGSPGQVVRRELATDPPLPRRVPRARPKPPAEIVTDLDILRRLRDHLSS
ncbi:MAG TPA: hypothetical protein VGI96_17270 [Streptosporangiaceae bacterium]|jgi:hypothetical protein